MLRKGQSCLENGVRGGRSNVERNGEEDVEESMKVGLNREDIFCRSKMIVGVNLIAIRLM